MVVFRLKKVSESTRKVQNVRQLITQIRQKVFQKGAFPAVIIYLERMVTIMKRFYTAESVTEGHPDKLCDLIADSILDACLKEDENSRVACEVLATKRNIIVAGEITSRFEPQVFEIIKKVLESAGYEAEEIHMDALIHKQSPDIAGAVERSRERRAGTVSVQSGLASGAGDQGIMIGYACDETSQLMPMPVVLANRIVRELSASRRSGYITGILPDGKAQVTVEYEDDRPARLDTVIVSCQHEKEKSLRKLEHEIREKVLRPALRMLPPDEDTKILINPSGRFVCGGLDADTGLTGRKLMVDTYGGLVPHGGGAFSGKDCSKVDRSGAYMARYIAKNMVAAGIADEVLVELSYAIGIARPLSVYVDTYRSKRPAAIDGMTDGEIARRIERLFDLRPAAIVKRFGLTNPIFEATASYGHFGNRPYTRTEKLWRDGHEVEREIEYFGWEKLDAVELIRKEFGL